jgi:hypothetical protein
MVWFDHELLRELYPAMPLRFLSARRLLLLLALGKSPRSGPPGAPLQTEYLQEPIVERSLSRPLAISRRLLSPSPSRALL